MAHMQMMGEENARLMAEVARLEAKVEAAGAEAERRGRTAAQQLDRERAKNKVQCSAVQCWHLAHSDPGCPPGAGVQAAGRGGGRGRGRDPGGGRAQQPRQVSLGGGQGGLPPRQRRQQRGASHRDRDPWGPFPSFQPGH